MHRREKLLAVRVLCKLKLLYSAFGARMSTGIQWHSVF